MPRTISVPRGMTKARAERILRLADACNAEWSKPESPGQFDRCVAADDALFEAVLVCFARKRGRR